MKKRILLVSFIILAVAVVFIGIRLYQAVKGDEIFRARYAEMIKMEEDIVSNKQGQTEILEETVAEESGPLTTEEQQKRGLAKGSAYLDEGKLAQAIQAYTKAINLDPESAFALQIYFPRGVARQTLGLHEQAVLDFTYTIDSKDTMKKEIGDASKLGFVLALAYTQRAESYSKLGKNNRAILDLNSAIALDPTCSEAFYLRGKILYKEDQNGKAYEDFDLLIQADPEFKGGEAFLYRGILEVSMDRNEDAVRDLNHYVKNTREKDARLFLAYYYRGGAFYALKDLKNAEMDYSEAVQLNPGDADALINRGIVRETSKNYTGAVQDYRRVSKLFPGTSQAKKAQSFISERLSEIASTLPMEPEGLIQIPGETTSSPAAASEPDKALYAQAAENIAEMMMQQEEVALEDLDIKDGEITLFYTDPEPYKGTEFTEVSSHILDIATLVVVRSGIENEIQRIVQIPTYRTGETLKIMVPLEAMKAFKNRELSSEEIQKRITIETYS